MADEGSEPGSRSQDALRGRIKSALEAISKSSGGISGLAQRDITPVHLESLVNEKFDGDLQLFIDSLDRLSRKLPEARHSIALRAALGIISQPTELGEAYADETKKWRHTTMSKRLGSFRRYWEEALPSEQRTSGFSRLPKDQVWRKAREWYIAGKNQLVELLAIELEKSNSVSGVLDRAIDQSVQSADQASALDVEYSGQKSAVEVETEKLSAESLELDDENHHPPLRSIVALAIPAFLIVGVTAFAEREFPSFTWPPFKMLDEVMRSDLAARLFTVMTVFLVVMLYSLYVASRTKILVTLLIIFLVLQGIRTLNYKVDEVAVSEISRLKTSGSTLGPKGFGWSELCPRETGDTQVRTLPFSSCDSGGGSVRAEITSGQGVAIGVLANNDTKFHKVASENTSTTGYYFDARMRPTMGAFPNCGITVESNRGFLFFHVVWEARLESYLAEASTVAFSDAEAKPTLTPLAEGSTLPYVGRRNYFDKDNDTWTRLTILYLRDGMTLSVNGREAVSFPYSGLTEISRSSVAVVTGSPQNGGTASCVFDHVEAGVISFGK